MKKVLVTGATGFLGAHICVEIAKAYPKCRIYALKHPTSLTRFAETLLQENKVTTSQFTWVNGSLFPFDFSEVEKVEFDTLVHAAAVVKLKPGAEETLLNTNYKGTQDLVNFCLRKKVKQLLYVSSIAAISAEEGLKKGFSQQKVEKHNAYGLSKYLGEIEVIRGHEEGLKIGIVRPGVILGKAPAYNQLLRGLEGILKGPYITGPGAMPYVHVQDVCKQLLALHNQDEIKPITSVTATVPFTELYQLIYDKKEAPKVFEKGFWMRLSSFLRIITWPLPLKNPLPKGMAHYLCDKTTYPNQDFLPNQEKLGIERCLLDTIGH